MTQTPETTTKPGSDYLAVVEEGLADAEARRIVPYEKIRRWLLSWGSDKESPPPECP